MFSDRASHDDPNNTLYKDLFLKVERLAEKISQCQNVPSTNIVINSCQAGIANIIKHSASTQTNLPNSTNNLPSVGTGLYSNEEETQNLYETASNFFCELCGSGFANSDHLNNHIDTTHSESSLPAENTRSVAENSL